MVKVTSLTAVVPSGKRLVTSSRSISAMAAILLGRQPLTAPVVSPATMRRWKIRTMTMMGMVTTTDGGGDRPGGLGELRRRR